MFNKLKNLFKPKQPTKRKYVKSGKYTKEVLAANVTRPYKKRAK